jgi:hypothetical protein
MAQKLVRFESEIIIMAAQRQEHICSAVVRQHPAGIGFFLSLLFFFGFEGRTFGILLRGMASATRPGS